jgi:hypothetical protein
LSFIASERKRLRSITQKKENANYMRQFIGLFLTLGMGAFILAAIGTFLNYLFGLSIGFKGEKLPDDPVIGVVFLVMAGIFAGIGWLVSRKAAAT